MRRMCWRGPSPASLSLGGTSEKEHDECVAASGVAIEGDFSVSIWLRRTSKSVDVQNATRHEMPAQPNVELIIESLSWITQHAALVRAYGWDDVSDQPAASSGAV